MKSKETTTKVYYLDAYPGVGKTAIAIDQMIRSKNRVNLYVAPRHLLLKEVEKRIRARVKYLNRRGMMSPEDYELFVCSDPSKRRNFHQINMEDARKAGTTLGALLKQRVDMAKPGDFIFCTHENFVRSGQFTRDLSEIFVVFDEARKMVIERRDQRITVSREQKEALFNLLDEYRTPIYYTDEEGDRKYSGFSRYDAPSNAARQIFQRASAVMHEVGKGVLDTTPNSPFQALVNDICNPKLDVYLKIPLKMESSRERETGSGKKTKKGKGVMDSVFQIISPAKLFVGYKKVLVVSAYFRQSQMFHLLQEYGNIYPESSQRFILEPLPLTEQQEKSVLRQKERIEARFRQTEIIPLLSKSSKVSMFNLEMSCLIPREKLNDFYEALEKKGIKRGQVGSILHRKGSTDKHSVIRETAQQIVGDPLPEGDSDRLTFIRHGFSNPIVGYIRMAQHVVYNITRLKGGVENKRAIGGRPLISMNKRHLKSLAREPNEFGEEFPPSSMRDCIYEPTTAELQEELEKKLPYEDRIYKVGKARHAGVKFDLLVPDPMGLNVYRERNCIAYISARNPSPDIALLFRALAPKYRADDDYAGDSAVQAVTRLSLRDPTASERVYIIVPDVGTANILARKLRPYKYGEIDETQSGARINLKYAKKLDYLDVLTELRENGYETTRNKIREGYAEEIKRWPGPVLAAHQELINPEEVGKWQHVLRTRIKTQEAAELALRKTSAYQRFVRKATEAVREDLSLKYLLRMLKRRTSAKTAENYARKREEAKAWIKENLDENWGRERLGFKAKPQPSKSPRNSVQNPH